MLKSRVRFCYLKALDRPSKLGLSSALGAPEKYWESGQTINVGFIGGTIGQIDAVKKVYKECEKFMNLKFNFTDTDTHIRVSFTPDNTSWSYEGTDALHIRKTEPTMNLGWLKATPNDYGTIRHEVLHSLGGVHEHQYGDIEWDEQKILSDVKTLGWDLNMVRRNITAPRYNLEKSSHRDKHSVMHYIFPYYWTKNLSADDLPGIDNYEFSSIDIKFWSEVYPLPIEDIYKKALQIIYEKDGTRLLKTTNKAVANHFGIPVHGYETQIVSRIKKFLNAN